MCVGRYSSKDDQHHLLQHVLRVALQQLRGVGSRSHAVALLNLHRMVSMVLCAWLVGGTIAQTSSSVRRYPAEDRRHSTNTSRTFMCTTSAHKHACLIQLTRHSSLRIARTASVVPASSQRLTSNLQCVAQYAISCNASPALGESCQRGEGRNHSTQQALSQGRGKETPPNMERETHPLKDASTCVPQGERVGEYFAGKQKSWVFLRTRNAEV